MGLFTGTKPEAKQYYVLNKQLRCHHCNHDLFHMRRSVLPMPPASFSDWAKRYATCYECSDCGFIHWFSEKQNT